MNRFLTALLVVCIPNVSILAQAQHSLDEANAGVKVESKEQKNVLNEKHCTLRLFARDFGPDNWELKKVLREKNWTIVSIDEDSDLNLEIDAEFGALSSQPKALKISMSTTHGEWRTPFSKRVRLKRSQRDPSGFREAALELLSEIPSCEK